MRREQWQLRPVMPVGGGNRAGRAARCRAEPTPRSLPPCARAGGSAGSEAQALTDDCQFGLTVGAPPRLRERVALRLDNAVLFCRAPGGGGGGRRRNAQADLNQLSKVDSGPEPWSETRHCLKPSRRSRDCSKPYCSLLAGNRRLPPPRRRQRKRRALPSRSVLPLPFSPFSAQPWPRARPRRCSSAPAPRPTPNAGRREGGRGSASAATAQRIYPAPFRWTQPPVRSLLLMVSEFPPLTRGACLLVLV
jgi:hypothetical protein